MTFQKSLDNQEKPFKSAVFFKGDQTIARAVWVKPTTLTKQGSKRPAVGVNACE